MGASAFLKSVDFRAFAVNVKTIAPTQKLYQSGHAIWLCVPQFDTMHPSMSLGAIFNDRNFNDLLFAIKWFMIKNIHLPWQE